MNIQKYFNLKAPFIGGYSLTDLKVRDHITIDDNISDQEIDNLEYLRNDFSISITPKYVTTAEELKYHKNVRKIIERLGKIRKIYQERVLS